MVITWSLDLILKGFCPKIRNLKTSQEHENSIFKLFLIPEFRFLIHRYSASMERENHVGDEVREQSVEAKFMIPEKERV